MLHGYTTLAEKDLAVTLAFAREHGVALPGAALCQQLMARVYGLDDRYRGVFGERRVVFVSPEDLEARGLANGDSVDIRSRHGETIREVTGFKAIAYDIPEGMVAAYFPEANPLVALEHHADESRTPASKSIVVTLSPAENSA